MTANAAELLSFTTIVNLHGELMFPGSANSKGAFNDDEEVIYNQICDILDDSSNLSEYIPSPPHQLMQLIDELEKSEADFDKIQQIVKGDLGLLSEREKYS